MRLLASLCLVASAALASSAFEAKQSSSFWMETISHGQMPFQEENYTFFRNVMDYGAKGDGVTDDTAAINLAVSAGNRCGEACGSTTISGALVYFPAGTYMVSSPIIQYYYTQFVGNPNSKPTIKGSANFSGIALIDTDPYIPDTNGTQWYINQNQFYRQIRNFIIDLTGMPPSDVQDGQTYVPTGIHWQVAQATSLQNIDFVMPISDSSDDTTAVGVFMENGSGGFVSDLTFTGGNIGFRAGTQQFTARNLNFTSCQTAISMIWDWGFLWKNLHVQSCQVALDLTENGGGQGQGTGSISVVDSHFSCVPHAINVTANTKGIVPSIVLDNLLIENTESIVVLSNGTTIVQGSADPITVKSWATGERFTTIDNIGVQARGFVSPGPIKSPILLDETGKFFEKSRPQYENLTADKFLIATDHGISNDATGDQTAAINSLLISSNGAPVFFPAGVYLVEGTVFVPTGSVIVGEGWSQIMGTGSFFQTETNPQVMVRFGNEGDVGTMEVSDILFTVQGPSAGAILVEWNTYESSQGAVGMWDCHFRVGGAIGTDLQLSSCPKLTGSINPNCKAASMLMHVTSTASGYFENVWAWVADHDIDASPSLNASSGQIDIYAGRGILIESQGPAWLYGTASEHSALYQYQLSGASNIYLGHMQTETPYYQGGPEAVQPYTIGTFPGDPTYSDCGSDMSCMAAYALRLLDSTDIFIYSAGFYSFFQNYNQECLTTESCQQRIVETSFTQGLWLYNLFTKGAVQLISPDGGIPPLLQSASRQVGYTTEISVWLPLALAGATIGAENGPTVVYVDPSIWNETNPIVQCIPPCIVVLPPEQLNTTTTISFPPYTTSITEDCGGGSLTVVKTTINIPPVTTTAIDYWNVNITTAPTVIAATSSIQAPPLIITQSCNAITTTFYPPPYPYTTPAANSNMPSVTYTSGAASPTCTQNCGSECHLFCGGPTALPVPCLECSPGGIPPPIPIPIGGSGGAPGGGPRNGPDDPNGCQTTTTTECATFCAAATPTSSCSTTCSSVIDCKPTGVGSITNLAPGYLANWEQWVLYDNNTAADQSAAAQMQSTLNSIFGTPTGGGNGSPGPTSTIAIEPNSTGLSCAIPSPIPGGTSMLECRDLIDSSNAVDPTKTYCTNQTNIDGHSYCYADPSDTGKCAADQSTDSGAGYIQVSSYFVLASSSECAFVVALKGSTFGGSFPNEVCVAGVEIRQFAKFAADGPLGCSGNDTLALLQSPDTSGTTWCLADKNNAGVCGA